VIIRGFPTVEVTEELVNSLILAPKISVYSGDDFLDLTKEQFVNFFLTDTPCRNLLEGENPPPHMTELMKAPNMFCENYYAGLPVPYNLGTMIMSTRLSYTKQHTDPAGSGAWMLLVAGEKRWTVVPPEYRSAIYSPITRLWYDAEAPHQETIDTLPFCKQVPSFEGFQRAGDCIWVPPAWSHRVLTLKRAIGCGAFYLHPALAVQSASSFIGDAGYHLPDSYLQHPNLKELDADGTGLPKNQSEVDYSVQGKSYHFERVVNQNWLPHIQKEGDKLWHVREEILAGKAIVDNWIKHQNRWAHRYPEDARAVHTLKYLEDLLVERTKQLQIQADGADVVTAQ